MPTPVDSANAVQTNPHAHQACLLEVCTSNISCCRLSRPAIVQSDMLAKTPPEEHHCLTSSSQAMQREAAGTDFQHRPIVPEDSLDIRERQADKAERVREFDWSGSTNYTEMNRKVWLIHSHSLDCRISLDITVVHQGAAAFCNQSRPGFFSASSVLSTLCGAN